MTSKMKMRSNLLMKKQVEVIQAFSRSLIDKILRLSTDALQAKKKLIKTCFRILRRLFSIHSTKITLHWISLKFSIVYEAKIQISR